MSVLKHIVILGPDLGSFNGTSQSRFFQVRAIAEKCQTTPGCLIIGDGKYHDVTLEEIRSTLKNYEIAPYARFSISAHGSSKTAESEVQGREGLDKEFCAEHDCSNAKLTISLGYPSVDIEQVYSIIKASTASPVIIDLLSCYSGAAKSSIDALQHGSILFAYTHEYTIGISSVQNDILKNLVGLTVKNFGSYTNLLHHNFGVVRSGVLSVTTNINGTVLSETFDPSFEERWEQKLFQESIYRYHDNLASMHNALCKSGITFPEQLAFGCNKPTTPMPLTVVEFWESVLTHSANELHEAKFSGVGIYAATIRNFLHLIYRWCFVEENVPYEAIVSKIFASFSDTSIERMASMGGAANYYDKYRGMDAVHTLSKDTLLHICIKDENIECVSSILEFMKESADVYESFIKFAHDWHGLTVVNWEPSAQLSRMQKTLEIKNKDGRTPWDLALQTGKQHLIQPFLDLKITSPHAFGKLIDLDAPLHNGLSPILNLYIGMRFSSDPSYGVSFSKLLDSGANPCPIVWYLSLRIPKDMSQSSFDNDYYKAGRGGLDQVFQKYCALAPEYITTKCSDGILDIVANRLGITECAPCGLSSHDTIL